MNFAEVLVVISSAGRKSLEEIAQITLDADHPPD
jgi:hypothetical protein